MSAKIKTRNIFEVYNAVKEIENRGYTVEIYNAFDVMGDEYYDVKIKSEDGDPLYHDDRFENFSSLYDFLNGIRCGLALAAETEE